LCWFLGGRLRVAGFSTLENGERRWTAPVIIRTQAKPGKSRPKLAVLQAALTENWKTAYGILGRELDTRKPIVPEEKRTTSFIPPACSSGPRHPLAYSAGLEKKNNGTAEGHRFPRSTHLRKCRSKVPGRRPYVNLLDSFRGGWAFCPRNQSNCGDLNVLTIRGKPKVTM